MIFHKIIYFFIIDSLMKFDISEDDYNQQKAIINVLSSLAKDLNIHIFLIHHVRKPNSQNTYSVPTKYDLKGTSAISDLSDNVLIVYRNLKKSDEKKSNFLISEDECDVFLIVAKQRNGCGIESSYKLSLIHI